MIDLSLLLLPVKGRIVLLMHCVMQTESTSGRLLQLPVKVALLTEVDRRICIHQ